jgi:hypothetical protein
MLKTESKFHEGDLLEKYLNTDFIIAKEVCHSWGDWQKHFESPEYSNVAGKCVVQLTNKIARSIKECGSKSGIDILYFWKYALEFVETGIRATIYKRLREVLTAKPTEIEKLSFEEKCLLEVMQEVVVAIGDGEMGGAPYKVTKEMVDAKIQKKMQEQKQ